MSTLIRLTSQPHQPGVIFLDVPPEAAEAMRKSFPPARRTGTDSWRGNFAMPEDAIEGLRAWANYSGSQLLDERGNIEHVGEHLSAVECGNTVEWITLNGQPADEHTPGAVPVQCGTPFKATRVPRICPSCGQRAKPILFRDAAPIIPATECGACHHTQTGRFPYCSTCGTPMVYADSRGPVIKANARVVLDDPLPIGQAVEYPTRLASAFELKRPTPEQRKAWAVEAADTGRHLDKPLQETERAGRPIQDVELPDPHDGNDPWADQAGPAEGTQGEPLPSEVPYLKPAAKALRQAIDRSQKQAAERAHVYRVDTVTGEIIEGPNDG